jgi:hypothetical protein
MLALVALAVVAVGAVWLLVWLLTAPPASFRNRAELPSCGRMAAGPGPVAGDPVDCFDAAIREGRPAELVVTTTTTEGDPIVTYYRALPAGGVEVFTDATEDTYGSKDWSHQGCSDARSLGDLGFCADLS